MVSFSADGNIVAYALTTYPPTAYYGQEEGCVIVLDRKTGKAIQRIKGETQGGAISPDGKTLALLLSGHFERQSLALWDVASGKKMRDIDISQGTSWREWTFHPDNNKLIGNLPGDAVYVWDTATGKVLKKIAPARGLLGQFVVSGNGQQILAGVSDSRWENFDPKVHKSQTVRKGQVNVVDYSMRLWDIDSGKETVLVTSKAVTSKLDFLKSWYPGNRALFSSQFGGTIHGFRVHVSAGGAVFFTPQPTIEFQLDVGTMPKGKPMLWLSDHSTGKKLLELDSPLNDPFLVAGLAPPDGRTLVAATLERDSLQRKGTRVVLLDVSDLHEKERARVAKLSPKGLDEFWADLAGADDRKAHIAMFCLTLLPQQDFLAFMKKHIPTIGVVDPKRINQFLDDLDSEKYAVRHAAQTELELLGGEIEPAIRNALQGNLTLEKKRRLEDIAKKVQGRPVGGGTARGLRVLDLLEHNGAPDARKLVELLAQGPANAWLTEEAKICLGRNSQGK
ncbi:MAG TPA: WD40 repeat domain-containing protein [Gemmataceae bacterium]|nr:WD40 repeat domain-containing protein [Gemmataceae bacterium]